MTARATTLLVIVCDTCSAELSHDDDAAEEAAVSYWPSRQAAVTYTQKWYPGWEMAVDTDGPDRCPKCVCARDGHVWEEPPAGFRLHYCKRCGAACLADTVSGLEPAPACPVCVSGAVQLQEAR